MRIKKRSARVAVASLALATGAALVGVGAAVAQNGGEDGPKPAKVEKADKGKHTGWAKLIDNPSKGKHKGWDVHGQHGGAPAAEPAPDPAEDPADEPAESPAPGANGQHKGWDKVIDNPGKGKHKGWDVHGQHGGAPDAAAKPDKPEKPAKPEKKAKAKPNKG